MALPPGVSGKTLTFGRGSFPDGSATGGRVTVTCTKNFRHIPSGRPLYRGPMTRTFEDGVATFDELVPNDVAGLDRYDWTYHVSFQLNGVTEQPESFDFAIFVADPATIDGDALTPVPSSIGVPVSVNALRIPPGGTVGQALVLGSDFGVTWGTFQPVGDFATNTALSTGLAGKVNSSTYTAGLATKADRLIPTATKTASYTAAVGDEAVMDLTSGPLSVTLPTAPANGSTVAVRALNASTTNVLTVTRGGTDTIGSAGGTSVTLPLSGETTVLRYDSGATRWLAVSNVKPLAALDTRYGDTGVATLVGTPASATSVALRAAFVGLQQIAATVSASGALVVQKHNPVDASAAARTMTLPTGQAEGTQVSAEKIDSSVNTVAITGNIRGTPASTIALAWQYETLIFRADSAGSWWPIAGHKTKTALDAAYAAKAQRIYLPVARLVATTSTVVLATAGALRGWALRDAANDHLGSEVLFPPDWATYHADVKYTNLGTTAGDVALRLDAMQLLDGANGGLSPSSGAQVASTMPAQFYVKVARVASSKAVDPTGENFLRLLRLGSDAADTSATSIAVLGMMLTKAS